MKTISVTHNGEKKIMSLRHIKLGDLVEAAVKPIAKALKLPCLDEQGNLKPESGCGKRKVALNCLTESNPK